MSVAQIGDPLPFWVCCAVVERRTKKELEIVSAPLLFSGQYTGHAARGLALRLIEDAYPFADGWGRHYVTDAVPLSVDTLGGMPFVRMVIQ